FAELLDSIRGQLPLVKRWYAVDDGPGIPPWAVSYEALVGDGADRMVPPWGRSGDDLLMLYTGGTTGMPKGVTWRQDDLVTALGRGGNALVGIPPAESLDEIAERATGGVNLLVACPMMHGTGQFTAFGTMQVGGAVVALPSRRFDPAELWRVVEERSIHVLAIVRDAFARPIISELEA